MSLELFDHFAPVVRELSDDEITSANTCDRLLLDKTETRGRELRVQYAPFDYVNPGAKIVIVGMTPGLHQARQALLAARSALLNGHSNLNAAKVAKVHASFSGEPMRSNLVAMLDLIGVPKLLGIESTAQLWTDQQHLVHFTSALRHPVFVDGGNWSGTPDILRTSLLCEQLESYAGSELRSLGDALIVPLGPKVSAAMLHLGRLGHCSLETVLDGLPHPSGANAERISFFLRRKNEAACSSKTNTTALAAARSSLMQQLDNLQSPVHSCLAVGELDAC